MDTNHKLLEEIFAELNQRILELNRERQADGMLSVLPCEVSLLGQMSLLASEKAAMVLALAYTGDMDALLRMDHVAKTELKKILQKHGLIYDEDSYLIWIPPGAIFVELFKFSHVFVNVIDPESSLVSKAVKAAKKNRQLIQDALASGEFVHLAERILANGGRMEDFL